MENSQPLVAFLRRYKWRKHRLGSFTAGQVALAPWLKQVLAVAPISNNRFVVALSNGGNFLKVIVFSVDPAGIITRQGSATVSGVFCSNLSMAALDSGRAVTVANGSRPKAVWWLSRPSAAAKLWWRKTMDLQPTPRSH